MLEISPDWIEAWAAVASTVFTMGALLWQAKVQRAAHVMHRVEVARIESNARAAAAARAQAIILSTDETGAPSARSRVWNYGNEPVTRLRVEMHSCGACVEFRSSERKIADILAPRTCREVPLPEPFRTGMDGVASAHVDIRFDDLHGNTWRRCGDEVILIKRPDADRDGRGQQPAGRRH
jgi:hypothetical protein